MLAAQPVAVVATDCSVTPNVLQFAKLHTIVVVPTDYETKRGRELCDTVLSGLGARGYMLIAVVGHRSACERLTAEARAAAVDHNSPMFLGPDGEDERLDQAFREFQLQERLRILRD